MIEKNNHLVDELLNDYPKFGNHVHIAMNQHYTDLASNNFNDKWEVSILTLEHFVRTYLSSFLTRVESAINYRHKYPDGGKHKKLESIESIIPLIQFLRIVPLEVWKKYEEKKGILDDEAQEITHDIALIANDLLGNKELISIDKIDSKELEKLEITTLTEEKVDKLILDILFFLQLFDNRKFSPQIEGINNFNKV